MIDDYYCALELNPDTDPGIRTKKHTAPRRIWIRDPACTDSFALLISPPTSIHYKHKNLDILIIWRNIFSV